MAESDMKQYVVTADAVNLTVGRKANGRPEVKRILRGTTINASPDDSRIIDLLAIKAAVPADSKAGRSGNARVTARMVSLAMGTPEDPVAATLDEAKPLDAALAGAAAMVAETAAN